MKFIRNIAFVLVALVGAASIVTPASAQYYPGSLATMSPNYSYNLGTFTATSTTGTAQVLGGLESGVIQVTGTSLTTATWAIQGSIDGGTTWFALPTAAYPTTAAPSTLAVTQTTTATAQYVVNLAGITQVRIVTSGTFTATNITIKLTASTNKGYL